MRLMSLLGLMLVFALVLSGCGGGGGGGSDPAALRLNTLWGSVGSSAQSLRVSLIRNSALVRSSVLNRASGSTSQSFLLEELDEGAYQLDIEVYGSPDAGGTLLRRASRNVSISDGTFQLGLAVEGVVSSVTVDPGAASIPVSGTVTLTATAYDADSNIVPVPNGFTWGSGNSSVASVSEGVVSGVGNGQTTITAQLQDSSVSGNALISVGAQTTAKWTVMVYMNAANDLDQFGLLNMNQLEEGLNSSEVRVVVQWKRIPQFATTQPWTGVRRYVVQHDTNANSIVSPIVQSLSDTTDMGNPNTLRAFVQWSKQNYPAERYALVIWNHGNGILRSKQTESLVTRNVSYDDGTGNSIYVWQLDDALQGLDLDMLVFDASLMQMTEVAWQVRNQCDYVVGSEESPPGEGYPYHLVLGDLSENPNMLPADFGGVWVERTVMSYQGHYSNITQSCVDTSQLPGVVSALNTLGNTLLQKKTQYEIGLKQAGDNASAYKVTTFKDLYDLSARFASLTGDTQITANAQTLQAAIDQAVIHEGHASARNFSHGLAIYYPRAGGFSSQYNEHSIADDAPKWTEWLTNIP